MAATAFFPAFCPSQKSAWPRTCVLASFWATRIMASTASGTVALAQREHAVLAHLVARVLAHEPAERFVPAAAAHVAHPERGLLADPIRLRRGEETLEHVVRGRGLVHGDGHERGIGHLVAAGAAATIELFGCVSSVEATSDASRARLSAGLDVVDPGQRAAAGVDPAAEGEHAHAADAALLRAQQDDGRLVVEGRALAPPSRASRTSRGPRSGSRRRGDPTPPRNRSSTSRGGRRRAPRSRASPAPSARRPRSGPSSRGRPPPPIATRRACASDAEAEPPRPESRAGAERGTATARRALTCSGSPSGSPWLPCSRP